MFFAPTISADTHTHTIVSKFMECHNITANVWCIMSLLSKAERIKHILLLLLLEFQNSQSIFKMDTLAQIFLLDPLKQVDIAHGRRHVHLHLRPVNVTVYVHVRPPKQTSRCTYVHTVCRHLGIIVAQRSTYIWVYSQCCF